MVKKQQLYVAKLVGWLNFRYYVIELHNRFYIIDYANPRDIRNYFSGFFPKYNRQYTIYDITNSKDQYAIKPLPWWQTPEHQFIELWSVIIWLVAAAILSSFGINFIHNDAFLPFWKFLLLLYLTSTGAIVINLILNSKTPTQLRTEKSYRIERKPQLRYVSTKRKTRTRPVGEAMQILIGLPICFIFTLNRNYMVMLFGFIAVYSILFIRFLNLFDVLSRNKFIFLEEED
ncbi:TPA: hypothetical protein ACGOWL_000311 [Streptococcus suis]